MALPILGPNNIALNARDVYVVNCCTSPNVDNTKTIFIAMCPIELEIVAVEQNYRNHDRPCRWLVKYQLKHGEMNLENAKASFENILYFKPLNAKCVDKNVSGPPFPSYNVLFSVTNCKCHKFSKS